jgi:hypothetical protein
MSLESDFMAKTRRRGAAPRGEAGSSAQAEPVAPAAPQEAPSTGAGPSGTWIERARSRVSPAALVAMVGLAATALYAYLGLLLVPLPFAQVDTEHFTHFADINFAYGSSIIDLSAMSPVQGLGGLIQPISVWINPMYLFSHILPSYDPRLWGLLAVVLLMLAATYLLGRALDLPVVVAVIGAQLVSMFSFPPLYLQSWRYTHLNGAHLYTPLPGFALPVALEVLWLAAFCYIGKSASPRWNLAAVVLMPAIFVYCVLCDPLYTALFIIPIVLIMAGVYFGSGSKSVFLWRTAGGAVFLAVCLILKIPQFFRALAGYAARAVFPNELYVEVQQWDLYTGLFSQGGPMPYLVALMMAACVVVVIKGSAQARGFAGAVLAYAIGMIVVNLIYVYSGVRWNLPLPAYFEAGAQPAYVVAGLLGAGYLSRMAWSRTSARLQVRATALLTPKVRLALSCALVLLLPLFGAASVRANHPPGFSALTTARRLPSRAPTGIVKLLQDNLAIAGEGRFRGSVANIAGVPGGELMTMKGIPEAAPFTKEMIGFIGQYLRTFDYNLYMTGLWILGIPTLEDNNHLVTPPFHYLVSRALSRRQDYHSRNWAWITKANPRLMATLGARYILADRVLSDPLVQLRQVQTNGDGVHLGLYEIRDPNIGDVSPTRTILARSADQALALMTSDQFQYRDVAVVHDSELTGLTRARPEGMFYERGGVRVRAVSAGQSLLVLPLQFSNSLRIVAVESTSSAPVRLIRVNLLETGVLFTGTINIKIAHVFGPFRGVAGRQRDIEDCRRLGIRETGDIPYPPNYQPLAGRWPLFGSAKR